VLTGNLVINVNLSLLSDQHMVTFLATEHFILIGDRSTCVLPICQE